MFNNVLKDLNIKIHYKPRVKKNNKYILDTMYFRVNPVE